MFLHGGSVLFLGAPFTSNSLFHVAEEIADGSFDWAEFRWSRLEQDSTGKSVPDTLGALPHEKRYLKYKTIPRARIINSFGVEIIRDVRRYDCQQTGIHRHLGKLESVYESHGALRRAKCGQAGITHIQAREAVLLAVETIVRSPRFILEECWNNPDMGGAD